MGTHSKMFPLILTHCELITVCKRSRDEDYAWKFLKMSLITTHDSMHVSVLIDD